MGGAWQDATPEWKAFMDECARKAREEQAVKREPADEPADEHEGWRRLNLGTDR